MLFKISTYYFRSLEKVYLWVLCSIYTYHSYDFNLKGGHVSYKMKLIGILYFLKKYIPGHAGAMTSNDITRFMQSMVYQVYHWYGMKDQYHTSAKHFQMIILHISYFDHIQIKSTCGLVRICNFSFFMSINTWCLGKIVMQIWIAEQWPLRWIIYPYICKQFVWADCT